MSKSPSKKSKSKTLRYTPPMVEICDIPNETEVYTFGGHGCYYDTYKTVPEGCVYLSLALCGTSITTITNKQFRRMFEEKSPLLKNPCTTFRKLNKILTKTINNPEYNDNTHMELITPDEKYNDDDSTYLNMHYNDTLHTNKFNQYLESRYDSFGYSEPTKFLGKNAVQFWKSGLRKMSAENPGFSNGMLCIQDDYFKDMMIHQADIEFLYGDSILPTLKNVLDNIDKFKHKYFTDNFHGNIGKLSEDDEVDEEDEESLMYHTIYDAYYFKGKNIIGKPFPKTYERLFFQPPNSYVGELPFSPIISFQDLRFIMNQIKYTQSQLFEMYPGIHYNIVCRSNCSGIEDEYKIQIQRQKSVDNKKGIFYDFHETEADQYFQDTEARTSRFKKAEKYGHKMSNTKSKRKSTITKIKSMFTRKKKSKKE